MTEQLRSHAQPLAMDWSSLDNGQTYEADSFGYPLTVAYMADEEYVKKARARGDYVLPWTARTPEGQRHFNDRMDAMRWAESTFMGGAGQAEAAIALLLLLELGSGHVTAGYIKKEAPLMQRLQDKGLVMVDADDEYDRLHVNVTEKGEAFVRVWQAYQVVTG